MARLVLRCEEDKANRSWLENRTMSCPKCQVCVVALWFFKNINGVHAKREDTDGVVILAVSRSTSRKAMDVIM